MYAVTARYCGALRFSPVGGIVDWMNSNRSRVDLLRHVLRKLLPASCGASLRPARSAMWQLAQLAAYTVAPVAAWLPLKTGCGCWPLRPGSGPAVTIATASSDAAPADAMNRNERLIACSPAAAASPRDCRPEPSRCEPVRTTDP